MPSGWFVVARVQDVENDVTPLRVGSARLMAVRSGADLRVFSAVCPHRGADLGRTGSYRGAEIVKCGFHGLEIGLGQASPKRLCVPELPAVVLGDMLLARLADGPDCGFAEASRGLADSHQISEAVTLQIRAPHELVIENAFDELHFGPVHDVDAVRRFAIEDDPAGALVARSRFTVPASAWQRAPRGKRHVSVPFRAVSYSPGLVITAMGGDCPYTVLTGATPADGGDCVIRLAIAVPGGEAREPEAVGYLLRQGLQGLERDRAIWESMSHDTDASFEPGDVGPAAFREFCRRFP